MNTDEPFELTPRPRKVYVYKLDVTYPEGSLEPGWVPANWMDPEILARMTRRQRRRHKKEEFRWPREHLFLSASGANERAWWLRACGATAVVRRSDPVTWEEPWECPSCGCHFVHPGFQHEPCGMMVTS
jgi:hypothetical protein